MNGGACLPGLDGCDCPEGWTGLVCNESEAVGRGWALGMGPLGPDLWVAHWVLLLVALGRSLSGPVHPCVRHFLISSADGARARHGSGLPGTSQRAV